MEPLALAEAVAGGGLLFFVPGFAVAKALFPERRRTGPEGVRWVLELVALGLVLSVVLTILVGYVLLQSSAGGFSASWSDPLLEAILAAVALVAFAVGVLEGAYARLPRRAAPPSSGPGEEGAWELGRELDRLQRQRLGLERELARASPAEEELRARLTSRLAAIVQQESALRRRREAEYDL